MTPALKTVGILVASGALVASSLLLTRAPRSAATTKAAPTLSAPTGSNVFLSAVPESSHALRGVSETHIAVSVVAPAMATTTSRPPLSVAIVLDRSGSMKGAKLTQAKRAAIELIGKLDARDHFSLTAYGNEVESIVTHRRADPESVLAATRAINSIVDRGGTNLSGGLVGGRGQLSADDGSIRRIVLISDGKANFGITGMDKLATLAAETAERGISVTTVGIGLEFDEKKMTAIAIAGRGNYYFAENAADLSALFATELGRVTKTAATDVAVTLETAAGIEIVEAYGHRLEGGMARLADLHAGDTRRVVFRVRGRFPTNGSANLGVVRLALTKVEGGARIHESTGVEVTVTDDHHQVISGQSAEAITMVERARSAVSLQKATNLYEQGDAAGARRVISERRIEAAKRAAQVGSAGLGKEMEAAADDADKSFAPAPTSAEGKSSRKRNRAKSYEALH